jgi:formylglycine-generating enzyme required for sulfatase activity
LEAFAPQPATPSNQSTLRLPTGFVPLSGPVTDTGWPQHIRCEKSGVEMALIPAQVTRVGSSSGPQETQPEHPAFVSAFYMDIHEVTLGAYLRYRDQVKAEKKNLLPAPSNEKGQPLEPVLGISWRDADLYAKAMGCELPTEAEWEAAGRGEQGFTFPWGEGRPVWSRERKPGQLTEVASYHTDLSRYGIFDLSGNAREWTQDWYQPDAFLGALERDGSPRQNWTGPAKSSPVGHRVIKGSQTGWELWARHHGTIAEGQPDVGFRCVLRIKQ